MSHNSHRQAPLMRGGDTVGCGAPFWLYFGAVLRFLEKIFIRNCDAQFLEKIWLKFSAVLAKLPAVLRLSVKFSATLHFSYTYCTPSLILFL